MAENDDDDDDNDNDEDGGGILYLSKGVWKMPSW